MHLAKSKDSRNMREKFLKKKTEKENDQKNDKHMKKGRIVFLGFRLIWLFLAPIFSLFIIYLCFCLFFEMFFIRC